jgi:hypothetical protein
LEQFLREELLVALLDGFEQIYQELVLPRGTEGGVDVSVALEGAVGGNEVLDKSITYISAYGPESVFRKIDLTLTAKWQIPALSK